MTTEINQVITGDVTAYNIKGKDHFCAALLDRHNHETIGRAVSDKNDTELVLAALENAQSESLNKTLKRQEINISDYGSREESAESIFRFIDLYNKYRPHSSLGGMTPVEFKMSQNFFMKE